MTSSPPKVKWIFSYATGQFLGSARVATWNKARQAPWGAGPFPAGDVLSDLDLKRLELDPRVLVFAE
jgi:hypothetical protein